jgi:hypothetical protein
VQGPEPPKAMMTAGFMRRLAALCIDLPLALIPASLLSTLIAGFLTEDDYSGTGEQPTRVEDFVGWTLLALFLGVLLSIFWWWRSPGGLIFRISALTKENRIGPRVLTGIARGTFTSAALVAIFLLIIGGFSDGGSYNVFDYSALAISASVFAAAVLGYAYILMDKERRSLQDRLLGVYIVKTSKG